MCDCNCGCNDLNEEDTHSYTNILTWQELVLETMTDTKLPKDRTLRYILPRRSGASKFMVDLANDCAQEGGRVLFITSSDYSTKMYKTLLAENVVCVPLHQIDSVRGMHKFDIAFGDNIVSEVNGPQEVNSQLNPIVSGFKLLINTR